MSFWTQCHNLEERKNKMETSITIKERVLKFTVCPVSLLSQGSPSLKTAAVHLKSLHAFTTGSAPSSMTGSPADCILLTPVHPSHSKILPGRTQDSSDMETSIGGDWYWPGLALFPSTL